MYLSGKCIERYISTDPEGRSLSQFWKESIIKMFLAWSTALVTTLMGASLNAIVLMGSILHSVFIGPTRCGKTEACFSINAKRLESRLRPAFVILDPHGPLAKKFGAAAVFHNISLIYDRVAETSNVPGYEVLAKSVNPDAGQREAEDRERINETKGLLVRSRGLLDTTKNPMYEEGLNSALNIYLAQREQLPFYVLRDCFFHLSDAHNYLKDNCTDFRWTFQFELYGGLRGQQLEYKCGPAERVLREVCDSPQFRARCIPTFNLEAFLNAGGMLVLDGESHGNLSRQDSALIMGMVLLNVIRIARSLRLTRRVVIVIDEGQSSTLVDLNVARALRESAKWGLEWQLILHTPFL